MRVCTPGSLYGSCRGDPPPCFGPRRGRSRPVKITTTTTIYRGGPELTKGWPCGRALQPRQAGAARALVIGISPSNSATAPMLKSAIFDALCLQQVADHHASEDEDQHAVDDDADGRARDSWRALRTQGAHARCFQRAPCAPVAQRCCRSLQLIAASDCFASSGGMGRNELCLEPLQRVPHVNAWADLDDSELSVQPLSARTILN